MKCYCAITLFQAPEPVDKWEGVKDCTLDGPKCVQIEQFGTDVVGSEDCLHLNVFTKEVCIYSIKHIFPQLLENYKSQQNLSRSVRNKSY